MTQWNGAEAASTNFGMVLFGMGLVLLTWIHSRALNHGIGENGDRHLNPLPGPEDSRSPFVGMFRVQLSTWADHEVIWNIRRLRSTFCDHIWISTFSVTAVGALEVSRRSCSVGKLLKCKQLSDFLVSLVPLTSSRWDFNLKVFIGGSGPSR